MARLEGTGSDPLGRYGKGEIFDVPRYAAGVGEAEREDNPVYRELIDKGWAKEVAPEADPGRTPSQIAAAKIGADSTGFGPSDPVDVKLADEMDDKEAYALVHTGDPNTELGDDLKPVGVSERQRPDKRAVVASSALQSDKEKDLEQRQAETSGTREAQQQQPQSVQGSGSGRQQRQRS